MTKSISSTKLLSLLCALLCLALLILQFTPFWQTEESSCSISSYIWFPNDHSDVSAYLTACAGEGYSINQILIPTILMLLLSAAGAVLCIILRSRAVSLLLPLFCGISGIYGFVSQPALRAGMNWPLQLILCVAMLVLSAAGLFSFLRPVNSDRRSS